MKDNNEGFSLVELIIIIGIIAVVTSVAYFGFGYLSMARAKGCATRINSGLSTAKTQTMSKALPSNLFIYKYDDNYYLKYSENDTVALDEDGEKIGSGAISITMKDASGSTTTLANGSSYRIKIARHDGSYKEAPQTITITDSSSTYIVYLVRDTGKHFIE